MTKTRFTRPPRPVLQPFVDTLWAIGDDTPVRALTVIREHVLPTGQMHLVVRLTDDPLRLFAGPQDRQGWTAGYAIVGGVRDRFYVRETPPVLCSVGAQLRPGAAAALFGISAEELAGRHTPLDDLWGREADRLRDRLAGLSTLAARVDALEAALIAHLPAPRALHPAVAHALDQFTLTSSVQRIVDGTGYSHRTMILQFRRSVGLSPKNYARVLRLQRALRLFRRGSALAEIAIEAGYSDQAHFSREFRRFTGVPPSQYSRARPPFPHHLAVIGCAHPSNSFKTGSEPPR